MEPTPQTVTRYSFAHLETARLARWESHVTNNPKPHQGYRICIRALDPARKQSFLPVRLLLVGRTQTTQCRNENRAEQEVTEAETMVWLRLAYQKLDRSRRVL